MADLRSSIAAYLHELLYEYPTISLPGLGTLSTTYKAAAVDPIQGHLRPPSKAITFNDNITVDDGLLISRIRERERVSYQQAQQQVADFVADIRQRLNNKEIIELDKVGRLYMDFEQKLKFLPVGENFSQQSYGLPDIRFNPVNRPRSAAATVSPATTSTTADVSHTVQSWFQRNLLLLSVLTLIVIAAAIYLIATQPSQPDNTAADLPRERINVSPNHVAGEDDLDLTDHSEDADYPMVDELTYDNEDTETDAPTLPPDTHEAVVGVGLFGNPDYAQRMIRRIVEAGYEPFSRQRGKYTQVGVQFGYTNDEELNAMLREIRAAFDVPSAKVIERK